MGKISVSRIIVNHAECYPIEWTICFHWNLCLIVELILRDSFLFKFSADSSSFKFMTAGGLFLDGHMGI